jgi:hypothetical protein
MGALSFVDSLLRLRVEASQVRITSHPASRQRLKGPDCLITRQHGQSHTLPLNNQYEIVTVTIMLGASPKHCLSNAPSMVTLCQVTIDFTKKHISLLHTIRNRTSVVS